jgi:hypothetical protein
VIEMESKDTTGCPSEEILCGFADGTLQEGRDQTEAHLASCERCLSLVADLIVAARQVSDTRLEAPPLSLERQVQSPLSIKEQPSGRVSFWQRLAGVTFSYRAAGAVATASIVALLVIWVGQRDQRPSETPSAVREREALESVPVLLEPRGEISPQDSVRFRWEPGPDGAHHVIVILNADAGTVAVQAPAPAGEYIIPTARLRETGGSRFEWMVECVLNDGWVVHSTALPFELTDSPVEEE